MEDSSKLDSDRRKFDRLELQPKATIRSAHGEHECNGYALDLSASGAQIKLDEPCEWLEMDMRIAVVLGWQQKAVSWMRYESLVGRVRRILEPDRIAVEFEDTTMKV